MTARADITDLDSFSEQLAEDDFRGQEYALIPESERGEKFHAVPKCELTVDAAPYERLTDFQMFKLRWQWFLLRLATLKDAA